MRDVSPGGGQSAIASHGSTNGSRVVRNSSLAAAAATYEAVSVIIVTYRREAVLLETLQRVLALRPPPDEVLVIDQTERHEAETEAQLTRLSAGNQIRWIRFGPPSITAAMNQGLLGAAHDLVIFLDDDVVPNPDLIDAHRRAHAARERVLIAGRVVQPWDRDAEKTGRTVSRFASRVAEDVDEFIGCNFSVRRHTALDVGGFDENFVRVAYRYEAEFAARFAAADGAIRFEPNAGVYHIRDGGGGTRSYGEHLTTLNPDHAVGEYYYAMRTLPSGRWVQAFSKRTLTAVVTRHHLRRPWWIPATLLAEFRGILWAARLYFRGPKLMTLGRNGR